MIFLSLWQNEPLLPRSMLLSPTCWFTGYHSNGSPPSTRRWEVSHALLWVERGGHNPILDDTSSSQWFPVPLPYPFTISVSLLLLSGYQTSILLWYRLKCVCSTESEMVSDTVSWLQILMRFLFALTIFESCDHNIDIYHHVLRWYGRTVAYLAYASSSGEALWFIWSHVCFHLTKSNVHSLLALCFFLAPINSSLPAKCSTSSPTSL